VKAEKCGSGPRGVPPLQPTRGVLYHYDRHSFVACQQNFLLLLLLLLVLVLLLLLLSGSCAGMGHGKDYAENEENASSWELGGGLVALLDLTPQQVSFSSILGLFRH
jgi:hypothetical protein